MLKSEKGSDSDPAPYSPTSLHIIMALLCCSSSVSPPQQLDVAIFRGNKNVISYFIDINFRALFELQNECAERNHTFSFCGTKHATCNKKTFGEFDEIKYFDLFMVLFLDLSYKY